jgi:hypothetical protein
VFNLTLANDSFMNRRRWLYVCSGSLMVASVPLAARCMVLMQRKPKAPVEEVAQQIGQMTNLARKAEAAKPPLMPYVRNPALDDIAREQAKRLALEQFEPTEEWMEERFRLSGYGFPVMRYAVRAGFCQGVDGRPLSVTDSFGKWLEEDRSKSQPQERGILNPYFADFGVGVYLNEETSVYYVAFVFAKRFQMKNIFVPKGKEKDAEK